MTAIGNFTRDGDNFTGAINTLTLNAAVTIKAVKKAAKGAPAYRIYAGEFELGAAWTKTSKAEKPYLSVKLDDPSFNEPIFGALVEQADGSHKLVWNR
jgi:uncharacterized protein (DUF736 family)